MQEDNDMRYLRGWNILVIDISVHKDRYSAKPVIHVYAVAIYMRSLFVVSARDEGFLLHTLSMMTDCGKWSFRRDLKIALLYQNCQ